MPNPFPDVKGILAMLVIIGSFGLIGVYVLKNEVPDATVVGLVALPLGAVIGFYFGHINGAATSLAQAATQLAITANASVEKRMPLLAATITAAAAPAAPAAPAPPPVAEPSAVTLTTPTGGDPSATP